MTYREADIFRAVTKRKKELLIKCATALLIMLLGISVIVIFPEVTVIFVCVLFIIISFAFIMKTVIRYRPSILFSKEISGVNIKEHEFVVTNRRMTFSARRSFPRLKPAGFTGRKARTKPPTSAIVYLRLPDGDVTYIDGLSNAQTDIYEIGDRLYKYAGTRYPIIVGREVSSQPCPLCGTANKNVEDKCITCGLTIDK